MYILDRRLNPSGKSLENRQRFLRRAKALVQRAVRDSSQRRDIPEILEGGEIGIPVEGVDEPRFHRAAVGTHTYVLPGNRKFVEGDVIPRPKAGGGRGREAGEGEAEDAFRFVLTREEFLDLFLEDLELPDLAKRRLATMEARALRRAGYTTTGSPANLAVLRTMRNALSRRIALRRPSERERRRCEAEIERVEQDATSADRATELRRDLERLQLRRRKVPYLDPFDLRFRRFAPVARPVAQAVMFCLMDV